MVKTGKEIEMERKKYVNLEKGTMKYERFQERLSEGTEKQSVRKRQCII